MTEVPSKNAPQLWGWAVAAGLGLTGFGVAYVPIGLSSAGAVFVGVVVALVAGIFLGFARENPPPVEPGSAGVQAAPAADQGRPAPLRAAADPVRVAPAPSAPAATGTAATVVATVVATRPQGLSAPRGGMPDDLKLIKGIGPALEKLCHSLGYYHFDQIAAWTPAEIAWVDENLEGFKGRVTRDECVAQARVLAAGGKPQ